MNTEQIVKLITASYQMAGYNLPTASSLVGIATMLEASLKQYLPHIKDNEIVEAIKQGTLGMFGTYGALSAATLFNFCYQYKKSNQQVNCYQPETTTPLLEQHQPTLAEFADSMFGCYCKTKMCFGKCAEVVLNLTKNGIDITNQLSDEEVLKRIKMAESEKAYKNADRDYIKHFVSQLSNQKYQQEIIAKYHLKQWFKKLQVVNKKPSDIISPKNQQHGSCDENYSHKPNNPY